LRTPISGTLEQPLHLLSLASQLHPTPAVGGLPRESALEWIAEHEQDRGWYAAPFGWFDAHGDGELMVALRSALLQPGEAHLFAGAGIVADSQPQAEYDETELKLAGMRCALGID
jgi:salicylate biosynthesis isochorismate synthase